MIDKKYLDEMPWKLLPCGDVIDLKTGHVARPATEQEAKRFLGGGQLVIPLDVEDDREIVPALIRCPEELNLELWEYAVELKLKAGKRRSRE